MLDVPIETAGKRGHRIAQARRLANAARLNVASAAWQTCSRVRSGLFQGPIAEAEAHRREAAAAFMAIQTRATGELDAAFAGHRDTLAKLDTANALLVGQQQRTQSAQGLFEAGASDHVEVLQTQSELYSVELLRASALIGAQQAWGALEDAMR